MSTSPQGPASPPKRRGRPLGSFTKVLTSTEHLGVHHFAFLRAWLQGIDLKWAWDRYLAFSESGSDRRHIEHRRRELLSTALRHGHQLNLTLAPEAQITRALNILSREFSTPPVTVQPTLDEFIELQGLDPDMYSEAELLEIYQEHYATAETDSSSEHVKALNRLGAMLAVPPSPSDAVSRWIDPRLADRLRMVGALTLTSLAAFVNVHGHGWFRKVPGLGEARAHKIVSWLASLDDDGPLAIRVSALTPPQRQSVVSRVAHRDVVPMPSFTVAPLEALLVPSHLNGSQGLFRTGFPNTLGASDDLTALRRWLGKHEERRHTHRSYKREVERFYLWCLHERRKALSSVNAEDCRAYRSFLAATPAHWINPGQTLAPHDWRPFRKQLGQSSQKLALVIVQTMFEGLRDAGYLAANPMSAVIKGFNLPSPSIGVDRSFTRREWDHLMRCASHEPEPKARTRLLLILELLVALGLRLDELATARRPALRRVEVDGETAWLLTVTGKRRKQREVPVPTHVVALIEQHHEDLREVTGLVGADLPLIGVTGRRVPRWVIGPQGAPELITPGQGEAAMSASGIYACLKRFFARAASGVDDPDIDPARLRKASTHWLRHTCGRQSAADDVPLEVLQQLLGHASLSTTTIYTTTERDRMVRELRKRRHHGPGDA